MKKKTPKRKASKKSPPKTSYPQFPSRFKIGQKVSLNFFHSGNVQNCEIKQVAFSEDKIYYDIAVQIRKESFTESSNTISKLKEIRVTLYNVDSFCVEPIKTKK